MQIAQIISISIAALALLALVFVGLRSSRIRRRLVRLTSELERMVRAGHTDANVAVTGEDEFGQLERSVNRALAQLREQIPDAAIQELFPKLAETSQTMVLVHANRIIYANSSAARFTGIHRDKLVGMPFLEIVHPEYRDLMRERFKDQLAGRKVAETCEIKLLDSEGSGKWVEISGTQIDFQGKPAVLASAADISARKRLAKGLKDLRGRAQMTLESIGDGVITTDNRGKIEFMNAAAEQLTGIEASEARGKSLNEIVSLVDEVERKPLRDPVKACLEQNRRLNLGRRALLLTATGDVEYSIEVTASPIRGRERRGNGASDRVDGAVVVLHDVSELRGLARQDTYQATHDALTGLLNRREFERRLNDALQDAHAGGGGHVLCYLDLDRFKAVNDTCGHMAGDNMLREVAGLIKEQVRDSDSVARLGGDEFGTLLSGCPLEKATQIADDIVDAIRNYRFVWRDKIFDVGVSIGLVEISQESGSVEDALGAADSACYMAKREGRGRVHVFSSRDESVARQRGEIQWLQRLQSALKENRFELFTQSIVSLARVGDRGPAVEILLRLRDEGGDEISPRSFMRAAERYHLMPLIDRWVVRTALAAIRNGDLRIPEHRTFSLNISGQTLGDAQFLEFVVDCLDRTGVAPDRLCFELTETTVVTNLEHAQRFIGVLHGMGCMFALDNFGSGLGSFANLRNLEMDFLKIDGSFVRGLENDDVNRAMINAMVDLARTLEISVIAEHVESEAVLGLIRKMGVDYVQGYGIERPRPLATIH
ncbi:MAG: EAL domain-containing protein [Gammaproteobacteria bacterium]|nr:EAL domain-containing protein [Gammaproteobacteria bacterium]